MSAGSQKHVKSGLLSLVTDRMCHFPACRGILLYLWNTGATTEETCEISVS